MTFHENHPWNSLANSVAFVFFFCPFAGHSWNMLFISCLASLFAIRAANSLADFSGCSWPLGHLVEELSCYIREICLPIQESTCRNCRGICHVFQNCHVSISGLPWITMPQQDDSPFYSRKNVMLRTLLLIGMQHRRKNAMLRLTRSFARDGRWKHGRWDSCSGSGALERVEWSLRKWS